MGKLVMVLGSLACFAAAPVQADEVMVPAILAPTQLGAPAQTGGTTQVQYYTPPPPYAYRKYYAYKNNTGPAKHHTSASKRRRHR